MNSDPGQKIKETEWNMLIADFGKIADKTGTSIDDGILETVVALNALSFPTSASCEGHLNWGIAAPWVDIEPKKTDSTDRLREEMKEKWDEAKTKEKNGTQKSEIEQLLNKYHELEAEIKHPTLLLAQKVLLLLSEFYVDKATSTDSRLIVKTIGLYTIRLESQGSIIQEIRETDERKNKLEVYQKEITVFTAFLKTKFLGLDQ